MIVRNISPDARSLFTPDAPPLQPGDEATIRDDRGIGIAWPKSTWEVVEPPAGCDDVSTDDAFLFVKSEAPAPAKPARKKG